MIRGSHNVKIGYDYQGMYWNPTMYNVNAGQYIFDRRSTSVPLDNSRNSGNGFASFCWRRVQRGVRHSFCVGAEVAPPRAIRAGRLEDIAEADCELRVALEMGPKRNRAL